MKITIATNNGEIGGGEVMLLNIARALRALGHSVTVLGPAQPDELIEAAQDEGFSTVSLPAGNRKAYMVQLRAWYARNRDGLLWSNGLVPALATAGYKNRIVHLHQLPQGKQRQAYRLARRGARRVLVPSHFVAGRLPGTHVFENWVRETAQPLSQPSVQTPVRIGFLGRPSPLKGTHTLAHAVAQLNRQSTRFRYRLVVAGTAKFIDGSDQERMQQAFTELGEDVEMLGWVTPEQLFTASDILVVPSEVEESFGLVAAEAMSARQPLIVSDAGALPEVVGENYAWVFRQGSVDELASSIEKLTQLLHSEPHTVWDQLSENYWRWHETYSPQAGQERVRRTLQELES